MHEITTQHRDLCSRCYDAAVPWRWMVIGVDGWTNSGKSTLTRFLSWQLDMPMVDTDLFLSREGWGAYRWKELQAVVEGRKALDKPLLIEGVGLLALLKRLGIEPNFLIVARNNSRDICDTDEYLAWIGDYEASFKPQKRADYLFDWTEPRVL